MLNHFLIAPAPTGPAGCGLLQTVFCLKKKGEIEKSGWNIFKFFRAKCGLYEFGK